MGDRMVAALDSKHTEHNGAQRAHDFETNVHLDQPVVMILLYYDTLDISLAYVNRVYFFVVTSESLVHIVVINLK